jgi:hypothetical protein
LSVSGVSAESKPIDLFPETPDQAASTDPDGTSNKTSIEIKGAGVDKKTAASMPTLGGSVEVPFQRHQSEILVEVDVNGEPAYMLFDTGATYVAIHPRFAKKAKVYPGGQTPSTVMSTANGRARSKFGIVERFEFANRPHFSVSYLICGGCPYVKTPNGRPIVGLLGRNVLRRYDYTIKESEGVIKLEPNDSYGNRWADIEPWLQMDISPERYIPSNVRGYQTRIRFNVAIRNRADIDIQALKVRLSCRYKDRWQQFTTVFSNIPSDDEKTTSLETDIKRCHHLRRSVLEGQW